MRLNTSQSCCHNRTITVCLFVVSVFFISCGGGGEKLSPATDTLTEEQKHLPENALKGLEIDEGLEVKPFATEPMLKNPTNIDVDERGRVWVTEAYNYRPDINGNPTNEKGDRIMILEDTNGDGKADTAKLFYQGPEINAPLGVSVLGNRVLVSQSPYVWAFYDDNNDDKADRKEILFQGIGGEQHDHGIHSFSFGPDGKLYFNFGNAGETLKDKNGKTVLDQDGEEISPKKYKQGMLFRCDPDGSNVECLAYNFRNPYEAAVDSYGLLWQSDNDDDGNRGVRINYVMDYGNYGFTDEVTGAGWQASRTNMEDSIPYRHWHLNDPGVVPNLLQTGAGSPTGMVIYEGTLLPEKFRGQMIHCDAGPNVVRSYPVQKNGAGYTASIVNILEGKKDQWFRPADVCVAPDGSLIIADWYDVGVGGHQAGDQARGRIYRVAPHDAAYTIPKQDYLSAAGAVTALQSPNLSVRYHAFTTLQSMGTAAVPELEKLWRNTSANGRMRARAFWALAKMPNANALQYLQEAAKDTSASIRMMAIRAARELKSPADIITIVGQLVNDADIQVKRECALALYHNKSPEAPGLWATLAQAYDGKDRWYLEALGIAADRQWDAFFTAYKARVADPTQSDASRNIVWRARNEATVPYLAQLAAQQTVPLQQRLKYFRAFDFHSGPAKAKLLVQMIEQDTAGNVDLDKLVLHHLDGGTVAKSKAAQKALAAVLQSLQGTDEYIELVRQYKVTRENDNLLQLALSKYDSATGRKAAGLLLAQGGAKQVWKVINGKDSAATVKMLHALSEVGSKESLSILQTTALTAKYPLEIRRQAAGLIGHSWSGEETVIALLKSKKVPAELIPDIVASVSGAWRGAIRSEAESYLPNKPKEAGRPIPTMAALNALKADAAQGKAVYARVCAVCHQAGSEGYDFGPKLTEIGSKYPPEGLLDAIVHPSAGISFGFEGQAIKLKDGTVLNGIIASKTETDIDIKYPGGGKQQIKAADVQSIKELKESMMPEGLHAGLTDQDMANLLAYLSSLKKK
ncbi:PVC-type heme-binding CxxCH protein [Foetidibacter luteolus]|uniref:PVC-type heme-binding CxxCH protein n=1 Tax=Foetidibacter luteolus TaxID=2608880 RepID=UPI00129BBFE1|nr:PVC-type heme-binding CxxCH protein [Foetidibacter luteolus]